MTRGDERSRSRSRSAVTRTVAHAARWMLGLFLATAGVLHLLRPEEFAAQVPSFLPWTDAIVLVSGLVEIALGALLLVARWWSPQRRAVLGWVVAGFFVAVFPGNLAQWWEGTDAFALDTDTVRLVRLFFQPVLVVWALWCTGAWSWWRRSRRQETPAARP